MGLWNWVKTQATGVDEDAEMARADSVENALRVEDAKDRDKYGEDWYRLTQERLDAENTYQNGSEYEPGFGQGLDEGANNVANAVAVPFRVAGEGIGAVVKGTWKGVPTWIWLALGAVLFFYLGGAQLIRPLVGKAAKKVK